MADTRAKLRERLNMKITASSYKRLPVMVREEQMDNAKKFVEQLQSKTKITTELKTELQK